MVTYLPKEITAKNNEHPVFTESSTGTAGGSNPTPGAYGSTPCVDSRYVQSGAHTHRKRRGSPISPDHTFHDMIPSRPRSSNLSNKLGEDFVTTLPTFPRVLRILMLTLIPITRLFHHGVAMPLIELEMAHASDKDT